MIFDAKCFQQWKLFWPTCDQSDKIDYQGLGSAAGCLTIDPSFDSGVVVEHTTSTKSRVCDNLCDTTFYPDRCARGMVQVMAPLYTIKATCGLFFPIFYHLQRKCKIMYYLNYCLLKLCMFCRCNCCNCKCEKTNQERKKTSRNC